MELFLGEIPRKCYPVCLFLCHLKEASVKPFGVTTQEARYTHGLLGSA